MSWTITIVMLFTPVISRIHYSVRIVLKDTNVTVRLAGVVWTVHIISITVHLIPVQVEVRQAYRLCGSNSLICKLPSTV